MEKIIKRTVSTILHIIFFLLLMHYFVPDINIALIPLILIFLMVALPNVILLVEYLIKTSKIDSVEFTKTNFKVYYKDGFVDDYNYNDLEIIELYKAAGMDKGNYSFNSNEQFYFANIKAKDGNNIILTSLLGPDLSEALDMIKDVPVDRTKTRYAFIFRH